MDEKKLLQQYRSTRIFVSFCFALLAVVILFISAYEHSDMLGKVAVQAYENPLQVVSSAIKGMAQ